MVLFLFNDEIAYIPNIVYKCIRFWLKPLSCSYHSEFYRKWCIMAHTTNGPEDGTTWEENLPETQALPWFLREDTPTEPINVVAPDSTPATEDETETAPNTPPPNIDQDGMATIVGALDQWFTKNRSDVIELLRDVVRLDKKADEEKREAEYIPYDERQHWFKAVKLAGGPFIVWVILLASFVYSTGNFVVSSIVMLIYIVSAVIALRFIFKNHPSYEDDSEGFMKYLQKSRRILYILFIWLPVIVSCILGLLGVNYGWSAALLGATGLVAYSTFLQFYKWSHYRLYREGSTLKAARPKSIFFLLPTYSRELNLTNVNECMLNQNIFEETLGIYELKNTLDAESPALPERVPASKPKTRNEKAAYKKAKKEYEDAMKEYKEATFWNNLYDIARGDILQKSIKQGITRRM